MPRLSLSECPLWLISWGELETNKFEDKRSTQITQSLSPAPLFSALPGAQPPAPCACLCLSTQAPTFPFPLWAAQPAHMEIQGDALMRGTAESLSFVDLLWGVLEKLAPNTNNGKQFIATKFFLMSHDWALGEWGIQKTLADGINMWNPGDKWRFPFLCNRMSLLNFNKAFQNIVNSPPNLLCLHNHSRKQLGRKLLGHCWYCYFFSMLFCLSFPNSSNS